MIKLIKILNEAKQVGTIYHFTSNLSAINIARGNKLTPTRHPELNPTTNKKEHYISFTRNKGFRKVARVGIDLDVVFVVDGNKLSNKYKIKPFDFYKKSPQIAAVALTYDEDEERIWTNKPIENFNTYVKEVWIYAPETEVVDKLKKQFKNIKIIK